MFVCKIHKKNWKRKFFVFREPREKTAIWTFLAAAKTKFAFEFVVDLFIYLFFVSFSAAVEPHARLRLDSR